MHSRKQGDPPINSSFSGHSGGASTGICRQLTSQDTCNNTLPRSKAMYILIHTCHARHSLAICTEPTTHMDIPIVAHIVQLQGSLNNPSYNNTLQRKQQHNQLEESIAYNMHFHNHYNPHLLDSLIPGQLHIRIIQKKYNNIISITYRVLQANYGNCRHPRNIHERLITPIGVNW